MVKKLIICSIRLYKLFVSPVLGTHCRFTPTCSAYAILAFEKYSLLKAAGMVIGRLLKCHPFHPGGCDPI